MKTEFKCDKCQKEVRRFKLLKKVNNKFLCSECYIENRKAIRQKHINRIKEEENFLKSSQEFAKKSRELASQRENKLRKLFKESNIQVPIIKNSKKEVKVEKVNLLMTRKERQDYLRMLMSRGHDFNSAVERVNEFANFQKELQRKINLGKKTESQAKVDKNKFLEELFNS